MKKFRIEAALHEIIRDLPEAAKVEDLFTNGIITTGDALQMISNAVILETLKTRETMKQ